MQAWQISKTYGIKKQNFIYQKNHEIKTVINRRIKFTNTDIKYMVKSPKIKQRQIWETEKSLF